MNYNERLSKICELCIKRIKQFRRVNDAGREELRGCILDLIYSSKGRSFIGYCDSFIKEYEKLYEWLTKKIDDQVVNYGWQWHPDKPSDEYITLLNYVRQNIYGARVNDMFNLLNKEKMQVEQKVNGMKISQEEKEKIFFDDTLIYENGRFILPNLVDLNAENLI